MHVFVQGVHVFNIHDSVEEDGKISGTLQVVNAGRFQQKLFYIRRGQPVTVLAGGRRAFLETAPTVNGRITLSLG